MWDAVSSTAAWMWANTEKLAALVTAAAFIMAAVTIWVEANRFRRTLVHNVHGQLFTLSFSLHNALLENPSLREFFYEGQTIAPGANPELEQRVKVVCEMFSDYFELVCLQMEKLRTDGTWPGWINYMTDVISQSPALRQHFRQTAGWVTAPAFQAVLVKGFHRAGEPVPVFGNVD